MAFANRAFFLSGFLTLVACPPPVDLASGPTQGPGGDGGQTVGEPGPSGAGEVAPKVDLTDLEPAFTQDAIRAMEHFTISGVLDGECEGYVRVQAIEDATRDPEAGNGLVTYTDVDGAAFTAGSAAWALAVPKDLALIVNALCDGNRDGIVDLATEGGSPLEHFDTLSGDVNDVVLVIADLVAGVADQGPHPNDPGAVPADGWVPPPPSNGSVAPPPSDGSVAPPPSDGSVAPPPADAGQAPGPESGGTPPAPAPEAAAGEAPADENP